MFKLAAIFFLLSLLSIYVGFASTDKLTSDAGFILFLAFLLLSLFTLVIDPEKIKA